MPHRLDSFFRPRSLAFVGATERSVWTRAALANLKTLGYEGGLHLVNRKGGEVLGRPAATSLAAIDEPVDLALLMVPSEFLLDTLPELRAAGIRNAVVLSAGFAESGADGTRRQQSLTKAAREHDIALLGPNCLGFVNFIDRAPVWTVGVRPPSAPGRFAIVSQSGALAAQMSYFTRWQGLGLTYMISTGNEAGIDVAQVIDYLVDEPHTRAIALFLESVRDPEAFSRATRRAFDAGKPIVVLKVGSSELTAKAAEAHTGSLVGNDRVFDAVCRQLGLVRVQSLEDLIVTAEVFARLGPLRGGIGLVSLSGGLCEIAADRADAEGVLLPPLDAATVGALQRALPGLGTPHNPLDVTGAVMLQPELLERSLDALYGAENLAAIVAILDVPSAPEDDSSLLRRLVAGVGAAQTRHDKPGLLFSHTVRPITELSQEVAAQAGVNYLPCGVHHGMAALGRVKAWTSMFDQRRAPRLASTSTVPTRPCTEKQTLDYLAASSVPVIPAKIVSSEAEAIAAARELGPVAMKIASPDIQHKSDIGGVVLNVSGDTAVGAAYRTILDRVATACPGARVDGIAISPMRSPGLELFVGTMRDAQWGPVLALGLGGIWVEALQDTSLRRLPVSPQDVQEMLRELRAARLLDGFRGALPVDRDRLSAVVAAIGDAALALGPELVSLEINPLRVAGSQIEALDALAVWDGSNQP